MAGMQPSVQGTRLNMLSPFISSWWHVGDSHLRRFWCVCSHVCTCVEAKRSVLGISLRQHHRALLPACDKTETVSVPALYTDSV